MRILTIISLLVAINTNAQVANYNDKLDSLLYYLHSNNKFIGNISVYKAGELNYNHDFDKFETETRNYHIGSVSKVFTATIIFQLVEENVLSLKTTLDTFFPSIKNASQITIQNLLSHTSGIYNITDWDNYYKTRTEYFTRVRVLDIINSNKPEFKPNNDCSYSNSNYILLGYIIEDITGKAFNHNIQERVCLKLGLEHTFCPESNNPFQTTEGSFNFNGETWQIDSLSDPSLPFAAGAIVSTSKELCVFIDALFNKKLISDSSLVMMKTLRNYRIGHGIFKSPFYEKEGWGHSGRIDENRAYVAYFPEDSLCIGITTNGINMKLNDLIVYIMSVIYNREFEYPVFTAYNLNTPTSETFIGDYRAKLFGLFPVATFAISKASGNNLFMSEGHFQPDQERILLERKDAYLYHSYESGGDLAFELNKNGNVKRLLLKQGKLQLKCNRIK